MAESPDRNESNQFKSPEPNKNSLAESTGTNSVTRTTNIESHLSVDAESASIPYSEDGITSGQTRTCPIDGEQPEVRRSEGSSQHQNLHFHHCVTDPGLAEQCIKEDNNGSNYGISSLSSSQSCSSLPADWDRELIKPDEVRLFDMFHVMILYSEDDRDEAEMFRQHLINDIKLPNKESVLAVLYDGPELEGLSGLNFDHLDLAFQKCCFTFVYLSKSFVTNTWCKIASESCLMRAIYDPAKSWRVVPVYTQKRDACTFPIPMGLNALKGINYYSNDEYYRKGVAQLIGQKVEERNRTQNKLMRKTLEVPEMRLFEMGELKKRPAEDVESETHGCINFPEVTDTQHINDPLNNDSEQQHDQGQMGRKPMPDMVQLSIHSQQQDIVDEVGSPLYVDGGSSVNTLERSLVSQEVFENKENENEANDRTEKEAVKKSEVDNIGYIAHGDHECKFDSTCRVERTPENCVKLSLSAEIKLPGGVKPKKAIESILPERSTEKTHPDRPDGGYQGLRSFVYECMMEFISNCF